MSAEKSHAVCFPAPVQGHITPALHLAKLLYCKGFHITFVNSEYNHRRLLRSRGPDALAGLPGFCFLAIPDGVPPSGTGDGDDAQDIFALLRSLEAFEPHFKKLLSQLNGASSGMPPVTCVFSDMPFALRVAREIGLPGVYFWTASACALMGFLQYQQLIDVGLAPLKDAGQLTNGYLDTVVDWVPGMPKDMRLRDFPSFIRTTDPDDFVIGIVLRDMEYLRTTASALVLNTFDELEGNVVEAMAAILPHVYTVGPLPLFVRHVAERPLDTLGSNLWKEDRSCLEWLQGKKPGSVVYVNFGSIVVMTNQQLVEFAWGLANSGYEFLWVIRNDQMKSDATILPPEFLEETKERGLLASWCPQEAVLRHEAVGAFLTHCGWNSTLESICAGVPMLCWPVAADEQTNCRYTCTEWRIGVEIGGDVERAEVAAATREVMGGEKGKEMKRRAMEWKESAARAALPGGPCWVNLERLVNEVLLCKENS